MTGAAALADLVAPYKTFSCDIFDTAIRRTLARPEHVFLAVGARLQGSIPCTPEAFAAYRQTAERAARATAEQQGHDEVRLAEIYDWLHAAGIVPDPIRAARTEFEVECAVCVPIEAVRAATAGHPGLVFASDTQWPGPWLQELLASCGYPPARRVFSSADLRLSKHTGRLFPAMLAALGTPAADVIHVGDNPVSDQQRPRAQDIAAHLLSRPRPPQESLQASDHITRLAISHADARPPLPQGPAAVGAMLARLATPLLIGFALFIIAEARRRGLSRIYFLARDGYLPMAIVQRLLTASGAAAEFSLHYLEVSRVAMKHPAAARSYLDRAGFLAPGPRMVVDLGWRGSIQAALAELAAPGELSGCYLGLWADALRPAINPANAACYLFAFGHPRALHDPVREFYAVLELIFAAPQGTVLGYAPDTFEPLRATEAPPGAPLRQAAFAALEADCLDAVDALGRILADTWPPAIDPHSALAPLADALTRPTNHVLATINTIPFLHEPDGAALLQAVNPLPLHEALLHPRRSLRRLRNAPWRAGAIRAALPAFLPHIDYATLAHRLWRIGIKP